MATPWARACQRKSRGAQGVQHPGRELVSAVAVVCLALIVTACGFHLRSWDVGTSVTSAYVESNPRNPVKKPLEQALRQAGVAEAASSSDAEVVVELLDSRHERRNATVSGQARVAEYEVTVGVRYRITDGHGRELVPVQWLQRSRVFQVDRDNIVGNSEEQALLEREIQTDLVQQILRALNAAVTEPTGAG